MSAAALQGRVLVAADCTIRFTNVGAATADITYTKGTTFASVSALLLDMVATATSGSGHIWAMAAVTTGASKGKVSVTTDTNLSIEWSHAGNGTSVRDMLGWAADIVNQPGPVLSTARHLAGCYLAHPVVRDDITRTIARPYGTRVSGTAYADSTPGAVRVHHDVRLRLSGVAECQEWESFLDDIVTLAGVAEPVALFADSASLTSPTSLLLSDSSTVRAEIARLDQRLGTEFTTSFSGVEATP